MPLLKRLWIYVSLAARSYTRRHAWVPAAGALLSRLAEAGTHGYAPDVKRRLMILNLMSYLIAISTFIYAVQHLFLDPAKYMPVILINLALIAMAVLVPLSHRISDIAGGLIIVTFEWIALFLFTAYLGRSAGVHLQYIVAAAAPFVVFGLQRLWLIIPVILSGLALHLLAWFWFPHSKALIDADRAVIDGLYTQAAITTFGLIAATVYYAFRLVENAKGETDSLLRHVLPESVVERLKSRPGEAIADSVQEASILFADISGFVPLARRLGAERTVELLNAVVTEFDDLAERRGVEKIKTIGDAYMVAAGVPEPVPDHVVRLARMALDMQEAMARIREARGLDIQIRIGLASGPVMAGVIGRQKFSYDVWGDAVNLAARLEAVSNPGRILVCPRCHEALLEVFALESRGTLEIKGVGLQEAFYLVGLREGGAPGRAAAE